MGHSADGEASDRRTRFVRALANACHLTAAPCFVYTLIWHFVSERAKTLAPYYLFASFYRFLTFWNFNLQCLQLTMALLSDVYPRVLPPGWNEATGTLACVAVSVGSTITTMYYVIRTISPRGLDAPESRIPWVNQTVHVWNSIVAWIDVLLSHPRRFGKREVRGNVVFIIAFSSWLWVLWAKEGYFPYPFMNAFSPVVGWTVTIGSASLLIFFYFYFARFLSRKCRGLLGSA